MTNGFDIFIMAAIIFLSGALAGWVLAVVLWRVKQTDYEILHRQAERTIAQLMDTLELVRSRSYENDTISPGIVAMYRGAPATLNGYSTMGGRRMAWLRQDDKSFAVPAEEVTDIGVVTGTGKKSA